MLFLTDGLDEFTRDSTEWTVKHTYHVAELGNQDGPNLRILVGGGPVRDALKIKRIYDPLSESLIWIQFAELAPTEAALLQFAQQYGRLGGRLERQLTGFLRLPRDFIPEPLEFPDPDAPGSWVEFLGESVDDWITEIKKIKPLFEFWKLLRSGDSLKLADKIKVRKINRRQQLHFLGDFAPIGDGFTERVLIDDDWWYPAWKKQDWETLTRMFLHEQVTQELHGLVTARMIWDYKMNRSSLVIAPSSLLGVVWLQFARALEGEERGTIFRQCANCGKWLDIRSGERADRKYCDDNCRKKKSKAKNKNPVTNP
jgi:hypothetical protein